MTATTYADIRRRLAEATGPDRELDRLVASALGYAFETFRVPAGHPVFKEGGGLEFMVNQETGVRSGVPPYTASLDAALALVEEMLPDHQVSSANFTREFVDGKWERGKAWAAIWTPDNRQITRKGAVTQALAVLSALFVALEASHG